jgi:hypothetical protein
MDDPTLVDYLRFWDTGIFLGVPLSLLIFALIQHYWSLDPAMSASTILVSRPSNGLVCTS